LSFTLWLLEKYGVAVEAASSIQWGDFFSEYEERQREAAARWADHLMEIREQAVGAAAKEKKDKDMAAKEEAAALKKFYDEKMAGIKSAADKENEEFMKRTLSEKGFAQWQLLQKLNLIGLDEKQRQQAIDEFNSTWKTMEANIDAAANADKLKQTNEDLAEWTKAVEDAKKDNEKGEERRKKLMEEAPDKARREVEDEMRNNKFGAVSAQRGSVEAYRLMIAAANENRKRDMMAQKIGNRTNQLLEEIKNKPAAVLAKAGR
jgi:hypothetical protein